MTRPGPIALIRPAALTVAAVLLLAACSSAAAAPTSAPTAAPSAAAGSTAYTVTVVQDAKLGAYLTGEGGKALYLLPKDAPSTTNCTAGCATAWPPFELDPGETVTPGDGVTGKLATFARADDGKGQVTYNGIPLYYFAGDSAAGDVKGGDFDAERRAEMAQTRAFVAALSGVVHAHFVLTDTTELDLGNDASHFAFSDVSNANDTTIAISLSFWAGTDH